MASSSVEQATQDTGERSSKARSISPSKQQTSGPPSRSRSFAGVEFSRIYFLEIFAGTARLSKAVGDLGFQCMPVDRSQERASQIHICLYDLADPDQLQQLLQFISANHEYIGWIHTAPACGTASRAREKALPTLEGQGFAVAKPLRSENSLSGWDKTKTEAANLMYHGLAMLILHAYHYDIPCSIENPLNSLFWLVDDIAHLLETIQGYTIVFDNCCHGGKT